MTHVERSIEVEVPVRTAYDQWTQFEEFPRFMSGVQEVRQVGDALTHWVAEIAGVRREWDAAILEQLARREGRVGGDQRGHQRRGRVLHGGRRGPDAGAADAGLRARGPRRADRGRLRRDRPAGRGRSRPVQGVHRAGGVGVGGLAGHGRGRRRAERLRDAATGAVGLQAGGASGPRSASRVGALRRRPGNPRKRAQAAPGGASDAATPWRWRPGRDRPRADSGETARTRASGTRQAAGRHGPGRRRTRRRCDDTGVRGRRARGSVDRRTGGAVTTEAPSIPSVSRGPTMPTRPPGPIGRRTRGAPATASTRGRHAPAWAGRAGAEDPDDRSDPPSDQRTGDRSCRSAAPVTRSSITESGDGPGQSMFAGIAANCAES